MLKKENNSKEIIIRTKWYSLNISIEQWQLRFASWNMSDPILVSQWPLLLVPEIVGIFLDKGNVKIRTADSTLTGNPRVIIEARLSGRNQGYLVNDIHCLPDRLICNADYVIDADHAILHWHVAAKGSELHGDGVRAYIGKQGWPDNGHKFSLSQMDISTASYNWSYIPMVPRIMLKQGRFFIGMGGTTLAHDFGMNIKITNSVIDWFRFNYGGNAHPMPVAAGVRQRGPRLQFQITMNNTDDQAHGAFTRAMIDDGIIVPKKYCPEDSRWCRPWYCSWGDQMGLAAAEYAHDVGKKIEYKAIKGVLTQDMVLKVANLIRKEHLNIGTIIIDDGWQDARGDWNLDTTKFSDMRRLVNILHEMDFLVMIWWAPFMTEPEAKILQQPGFTAGPMPVYGQTVIDYTQPQTRDWIQRKLDLWFGSGPGCWDIDGVKLDFIAEQVYPWEGGDLDWRGEERLINQLFKMVHDTLAKYKVSPGIWTSPFNPHLSQWYMALGYEERFDRDMSFFAVRQAMADALCPGLWFSPHFNYHPDTAEEYVSRIKAQGGIPQFGKLISPDVTPEVIAKIHELLDG